MNIKHTEETIQKLLHYRYSTGIKYKINNAYIFRPDWESDFFVLQNKSGYCYEIEIKINKSDFKNDVNKVDKHSILKTGAYTERRGKWGFDTATGKEGTIWSHTEKEWKLRPNKFYYCVPKDLIDVKDIPDYAGLMYATNGEIITVKEAPFLHKEKLKLEEKLCNKFYWYWLKNEEELYKLRKDNGRLYDELNELNELRELTKKVDLIP